MPRRKKHPTQNLHTVFLSSTFRDMEAHRAVLKLALESSGYRVLGMELFTASEVPPIATCLEDLDRSDIYIGVIGEIYGSCPPSFKKSYTQLEYERALKKGMPIFMFLTADDAHVTPAQIEKDPEKSKRLSDFKKALKKDHTIGFFKDAHHAAWQILAALHKHTLKINESSQTT